MNISLWSSLAVKADRMAADAFDGIITRDDWEEVREERRAELLKGLGLDPFPPRCDLDQREYGSFCGDGFHARKVGYQILPDCWGSATIYYPDPLPSEKLPAVLYLCGHAPIGTDHYQAHGLRWARRGYVCMIVDTIEQNDNLGEHHGFNMGCGEEWLALGYSGGGGEIWNSIRALDLLAADPRVDAERLAATGVSGGGACSFFLSAVDERIKALSSLCGVSTPRDAVTNRHLLGHCDCFYPLNAFSRDWSVYAGLIAPRPALFCNADQDPLFHPIEVEAFVERTRHIYDLYAKEEACQLVTCSGPHGDHSEFDEATAAWFDRYVAGKDHPPLPRGGKEIPEAVLSVFNGVTPQPNRLYLLPHLITQRGSLPLPQNVVEWSALRLEAVEKLRREVIFRNGTPLSSLAMSVDGDWLWTPPGPEQIAVTTERGENEGVPVWLQQVNPAGAEAALISIAGEGETMQQALARAALMVDRKTTVYAGLEPRFSADRSPAPDAGGHYPGSRLTSSRTALIRAMALTGTTPVMMVIEDVLAVVNRFFESSPGKTLPLYLHGRGAAGVAALYASVLDDRISGVIVEDPPGSHLTGAPILGILRLFDLPQAVGLMAPRPVALVNPVYSHWTWPSRLYQRLGHPERYQVTSDAREAFEKMRNQAPVQASID